MNVAESKLAKAITTYFGSVADKREPIRTTMVDEKTVGTVSNRNFLIASDVSVKLKANKANKHLLHVIRRNATGILSLHTIFPFQNTTLNRRGTGLSTANVAVITPASSQQHKRSIGAENKAIAFGNSNFAAFARLFSSQSLNGATIVGNLTETYIPKLNKTWTQPYHTTIRNVEGTLTVGQAINHLTLLFWSTLKAIEADSKLTDADREKKIKEFWDQYQSLFKDWIVRGYLDTSLAIYAEPNSVDPDVSAYLGVSSPTEELDASKIHSLEGETSTVAKVNRGYLSAVILADEADDEGKFKFGIFKQNAANKDDLVTLENDEEITNTPEVCTRRVLIVDGAGETLKVQVRVKDETYGENSRPIKHSRSFYNLPVGTPVDIRGELTFRLVRDGSQAITAEVESTKFKAYATNNMIVGDLTTVDNQDFTVDPDSTNFLEMIGANADTLLANAPEQNQQEIEQTGVQPTETQTDENM